MVRFSFYLEKTHVFDVALSAADLDPPEIAHRAAVEFSDLLLET
jgi:hypothetical protein